MTADRQLGSDPPIVQYWHSRAVPGEIAALIETFRDRNPDLRHILFCEEEAERLIAEHFGPREVAAFRSCAVPAMQADYFRYSAVCALGGVYADADLTCLRPLRELVESVRGGRLFRRNPPGYMLNGFFFFAAPGHPLLRLTLEVATANIEGRIAERVQMVTGPWLFSGLAALHRLGSSEPGRSAVAETGLGALMEPFCRAAEAGVPTAGARTDIPTMARALLETVGDYARVARAFDGVVISPVEAAAEWIGNPDAPLTYRRGDAHWINWQNRGRSIFR